MLHVAWPRTEKVAVAGMGRQDRSAFTGRWPRPRPLTLIGCCWHETQKRQPMGAAHGAPFPGMPRRTREPGSEADGQVDTANLPRQRRPAVQWRGDWGRDDATGAGPATAAERKGRAGLAGAAGTSLGPVRRGILRQPQFPPSGVSPAGWARAAAQAARSDDVAGKALELRRRLSEPRHPSSVNRSYR